MIMMKMTKRDYFNALRARVVDDADLTAFIDHELELLARKNERKNDKPTARQIANADLIEKIYSAMESDKAYTATDIQHLIPDLADAKIQKVTHLITAMRNRVLVSREVIKGKAYFTKI